MREMVFAGKAPPSLLNIAGTAGHINNPLIDPYSVSMSLSNKPSYTLIGQRSTPLTSSPGPYLLPSLARSGTGITKRFVAACRACLGVLILSELYSPATCMLQQTLGTIQLHLLMFGPDREKKCRYDQTVSCIVFVPLSATFSSICILIGCLDPMQCPYQFPELYP